MRKSNLLKLISIIFCLISAFSACVQFPAQNEPATISPDDRLTESDFAILIGRRSGLITYVGPNGDIFTIDQSGRALSPITTDSNLDNVEDLFLAPEAIYYLLPTWSTSGQKLAFAQHHVTNLGDQDFAQVPNLDSKLQKVSLSEKQIHTPIQQGQEGRTSRYSIFAADADGADKQRLWSGTARPIYMYWAPDGVTLSVLLQEVGASALQLALLSVDEEPATTDTVNIVDVGGPLYWDWAPHSRQLLTHIGSVAPSERVSLLSLENQVVEEVLNVAPARFSSPDISPDGQNVLLPLQSDSDSGEESDDTWVSIINLSSRKKSVIDKIDGDLFIGGAFSPDSSKVGYIASKSEVGASEGELAIYTLQTGGLITSEAKNLIAFFWSPDSSKIAWFELIPADDESTPGRPKLGLHIFDVATQNVIELVKPFETTTQFTEVLTFYSQYQRSATIWSPNSQSVVLPVRTPEGPVIIAMDVSGEIHPRTLASGVLAFWSAD